MKKTGRSAETFGPITAMAGNASWVKIIPTHWNPRTTWLCSTKSKLATKKQKNYFSKQLKADASDCFIPGFPPEFTPHHDAGRE